MKSLTPETDDEFDRLRFVVEPMSDFGMTQRDEVVFGMRDLARKLERERDEARKRVADLEANNRYQRGYAAGEDSTKAERDQLRKACDMFANGYEGDARQLYHQLPHVKSSFRRWLI